MDSEALIQLALNTLNCSQKELALRMGVSPAQISKWKKGDHLSTEMQGKLRAISKIGDRHPEFVLWAGSLNAAIKWERLLATLAKSAADGAETGYRTPLLEEREQRNTLCWDTFYILKDMGVGIPPQFPAELDVDRDSLDDTVDGDRDSDKYWKLIDENVYSSLIYSIYKSHTDVYGFYSAYVSELLYDDELDIVSTDACDIDSNLLSLAASKLETAPPLAKNFLAFKRKVRKDYEEWLTIVKDRAFRAGVPIRAELLEMVYKSHDQLGHQAEAESLGLNVSRLHPDVYMNELLCGMRAIHQVLPVIMKKLGIYDEFELDGSKLRIER